MFKLPAGIKTKVIVPSIVEKPVLASLQPQAASGRKMIGGAAGVRKIMFM